MKVSDLYAEIGFKVETKGLSDFEKSIKSIQKSIKGGLTEIKEFAKAADQIARAFSTMAVLNSVSDKDIRSRYRAITSKMRADARLERGVASGLFSKSGNGASASVSSLITGFGAAVYIFKAATDVIRTAAEVFKEGAARVNFEYQTGLSAEPMRLMEQQMERSGLSLGRRDVRSFLTNLQQKMIDVRFGGDVSAFTMMGVSPYGKDVYRMVHDIGKALEGVDNATAINRLKGLGVTDPDMVRLLRGELSGSVYGDMVTLSPGEEKDMTESWKAIKALGASFRDFFAKLGSVLAPLLTPIIKALTFIVDTLTLVASAIQEAVGGLSFLAGVVVGGVAGIGAWIGKAAASIVDGITTWWEENMPELLGGKPNKNIVSSDNIMKYATDFSGGQNIKSLLGGTFNFSPAINVNSVEEATQTLNGMVNIPMVRNAASLNSDFVLSPIGV